jgi:hypothetical protein
MMTETQLNQHPRIIKLKSELAESVNFASMTFGIVFNSGEDTGKYKCKIELASLPGSREFQIFGIHRFVQIISEHIDIKNSLLDSAKFLVLFFDLNEEETEEDYLVRRLREKISNLKIALEKSINKNEFKELGELLQQF